MNNLTITCIAVDDEPLALEKMKNFIAKVDYLKLEQVFENPLDAVSYLKENERLFNIPVEYLLNVKGETRPYNKIYRKDS